MTLLEDPLKGIVFGFFSKSMIRCLLFSCYLVVLNKCLLFLFGGFVCYLAICWAVAGFSSKMRKAGESLFCRLHHLRSWESIVVPEGFSFSVILFSCC